MFLIIVLITSSLVNTFPLSFPLRWNIFHYIIRIFFVRQKQKTAKRFFPNIQFELCLVQLCSIPMHPVTGDQREETSTSLALFPLHKKLQQLRRLLLSPLFSTLGKQSVISLSSYDMSSSAFACFVVLLLTSFQYYIFTLFIYFTTSVFKERKYLGKPGTSRLLHHGSRTVME